MDIIENIIKHFRKPKEEQKEKAPEGVCALCWGRQEYDHKIRTLFKDKQVDVNNHKASYMLVQGFVKKNIDGIKLKEGKTETCPTCGDRHE
jgi:hypothetical protein